MGLTGLPAAPSSLAFVEGQEDGGFARELGAEHGLVLVDREMDGASADVEQVLTRAAGLPVLLDGVADRLLGEVVLELEGGDGQAVDEKPQVEGALSLVVAVPQLAGDGETVLGVAFLWRWRSLAWAYRRRGQRGAGGG